MSKGCLTARILPHSAPALQSQFPDISRVFIGAGGGTRTRTPKTWQGILRAINATRTPCFIGLVAFRFASFMPFPGQKDVKRMSK
jgi:hypothetical protein